MISIKGVPVEVLDLIDSMKICDNFKRKNIMGNTVESVHIRKRHENPSKYAIEISSGGFSSHPMIMNKKGETFMDYAPSDRTEEYLKEVRYDSIQEALDTFYKFQDNT